jgi:hypothetical protein
MMLSNEQIERWSRQILLPDVGGRGQLRLLAARVGVLGCGPAADPVADLLRRAGVPASRGVAPADADVVVDLDGGEVADIDAVGPGTSLVRGRVAGAAGWVETLVGRPCGRCAPLPVSPSSSPSTPLAAPAGLVLGSLAAAEVVRILLARPEGGRRHAFDLDAGTFTSEALAGDGCAACGGRA